ncbi:hypothetical protein E4T66_18280 [Sinimarinibacterium sp. CAU 1509]|uniref:type IV secretory system conjugative DNA transfer family protein n=1 Tax=Sinimarinibacterium sp. CAU 1509 TaxID=2562283 RepID=UPI0010ABAC61|nr:TraM recognition domain-containing protein [Sinimarinibacterium sp. CAU 1509]TJY57354.1 hypothetical protein E4T66_18280 [Sinimarinibacterium sp. CAU 1509]
MNQFDRYTSQARLQVRLRNAQRRLLGSLWTPALAAAAPFLPAPLYGALGAGAGLFAARRLAEIHQLEQPPPVHESYAFAPRVVTGPSNGMYFGQSLDFLSYKAGLESLRAEHGRVTPEQLRGYNNATISAMKPMFIADAELAAHVAIMGSPGQGKTELLLALCEQQVKRGGGMIIFDPKSDEEVFARVAEIMRVCYREHDLRYFNPDRPQLSHTYNPLLYGGTRHIVSTGMKLAKTPSGGDDFFYRMTRLGMLAAIVCLKSQPSRTPISFADLAPLFSDLPTFIRLWQQIPEENREAREFVYQFLSMWLTEDSKGNLKINRTRYLEILAGLKQMVMDFCHSEYRALLNSYNPDINLKDVIENGQVLYVGFSALTDKQGSNVFGRLMLADLARAIGEIFTERTRPAIPPLVFMDEYGSSADEADLELFQMGRSARVPIIVAVQGRGFLDSVNQQFMPKLLDATANHIFMRVSSEETRSTAAKLAGSTITRFAQTSDSRNFGRSYSNYETGLLHDESHGRSVSTGTKETREDLIQPEDFMMERGDAIIINSAGSHKLRLPLIQISGVPHSSSDVWLPRFARHKVKGLDLMSYTMERDSALLDSLLSGPSGMPSPKED